MQTKFNLYPKEQLPEKFKFPQSYIDLSSNMEKINELEYFPWWFENHRDSIIQHSAILEEITAVPNLISFARNGDLAACFDLTDCSGNPRVYVYDLGANDPPYEKDSFDEWLSEEIKDVTDHFCKR